MFDRVVAAGLIAQQQGCAFVYVPDDQREDVEVDRSLRILGSVTRVLNVTEADRVTEEFRQLPLLGVRLK